ncbi:MAG TPA: di-heme oxidoredictase family protein [Kofleriaceae bacterium]
MKALVTASLLLPASWIVASCSASQDGSTSSDPSDDPVAIAAESTGVHINAITEAPTGFDNLTNGFSTQAQMDAAKTIFADEVEEIADGLGPTFNAQSCRECHQNPVTGAASQTTEFRNGHFNGTSFVDPPGGSLQNDRAINASIQPRIASGQEVRTFRISLSLMGDGFIEAVDSSTITAIQIGQTPGQRGTLISVPVLEAPGQSRLGRFGWKNQQASLLSFAADAYVNEEGITSPLQPAERITRFDTVTDPEDVGGADIAQFALFMRSLKAPAVDAVAAATASAKAGSALFDSLGCAICHVRTMATAAAGTVINGGTFTVPAALGDKNIHPFCDLLLHDVGTGDGIVQNGGQGSRNMVRTACLWGLRARSRLMHDGESVSLRDAILRHGNQGLASRNNFAALSAAQQQNVIDFLNSL